MNPKSSTVKVLYKKITIEKNEYEINVIKSTISALD